MGGHDFKCLAHRSHSIIIDLPGHVQILANPVVHLVQNRLVKKIPPHHKGDQADEKGDDNQAANEAKPNGMGF